MAELIGNERSWWGDLISKINQYLNEKSFSIKKASWESWLKCWKKTLFPDVLLFWWAEITTVLHWWELKLPDTNITDVELIKNATIKAEALQLNSFLLWNFSVAVLYVKEWNNFLIKKEWDDLHHINTRRDALDVMKNSPELWGNMLMKIIDDLNQYFLDWVLIAKWLVDVININTIIDSISGFSLGFQDFLKRESITNIKLKWEIDLWWYENKLSYQEKKDDKKLDILTKIIINNWVNKIIYAHILKKHYNEALIIEDLSNVNSVEEAINIFDTISESCDFWNIFRNYSIKTENINADLHIPDEILNAFKNFNSFLNDFDINNLSSEIIEKILINTIFQNKRKLAGQFSTPDKLAKILVKSTIEDKTKIVYDWCCGTWTIIKEVYNYKNDGLSDEEALSTLYASDKFSFPIQISNLNLSKPSNKWRLLQLFKEDIFNIKVWSKFKIYNPNNWEEIEKQLPELDYILSNLPFIRQEDFKKLNSNVKEKVNSKIKEDLWDNVILNWKSDLYAYVIIYLYSLLSSNWKLWIIISNSWLSNDWGNDFQKILLSYFYVEKIITSWKWKWFNNADIITNILILKKRERIWNINIDEQISFITINKELEELNEEWINNISSHILLNREWENLLLNKVLIKDINDYSELNIWWNAYFSNTSFLKDISEKIVNLNTLFNIKRWEKTGCDPLFYPWVNHWIENEFILKTLKTTKWKKVYDIELDRDTFICNVSNNELVENNKRWALNWINRFESKKWSVTRKEWKEWYTLPSNIKVDFVINVNPDKNIVFYWLDEKFFIGQRWIWLEINNNWDKKLLYALLNSILSIFFVEAVGFWRWLWALDLNSTKIKNMKILNPDLLTDEQKNNIIKKFNILKGREIKNIDEEFNLNDRIEFDKYVLSCYWLDEIYENIKKSLFRLYLIRSSVR